MNGLKNARPTSRLSGRQAAYPDAALRDEALRDEALRDEALRDEALRDALASALDAPILRALG